MNSFAIEIKSSLSVRFLWTWTTVMLFNRCCHMVLCKYDFAHHIPLNDCSAVKFVAVATSTKLVKHMICDNNNLMPGDNFCKYVQTADKVILEFFSVFDWKLLEKVRSCDLIFFIKLNYFFQLFFIFAVFCHFQ